MSICIMTEVWKHAPFEGYTLLALLALADSANDDGLCWPSFETLMRKTRQPKRTVYQALKNLEEAGWLVRCEAVVGGEKKPRAFRVVCGGSAQPAQNSAPHAPESAQPALFSAQPAHPPHPLLGRTVIEPSENHTPQRGASGLVRSASKGTTVPVDWPASVRPAVAADFEAHRKAMRKPLTPSSRRLIVRRLEGCRARGYDPNAVLEESIANGWTGVFEPKDGSRRLALVQQPKPMSAIEKLRRQEAGARA